MNNHIMITLTGLLSGVLYYSESENPFRVADWGIITYSELLNKVAEQYEADPSNLKQLDPAVFFEHLISKADPADAQMQENAGKIASFYAFFRQNFSNIQVIRVEGRSKIPVLIAGYLPDGTCLLVETFSVET